MIHKIIKNMRERKLRSSMVYKTVFTLALSYSVYYNWELFNMAIFKTNTRQGSRRFGEIGQMNIPKFARFPIFSLYCFWFGVIQEDMLKPLNEYPTLNEFFTREVHPRDIDMADGLMVAPADSKILSVAEVTKDLVLAVKGVDYSLGEFLFSKKTPLTHEDIQAMKKNPENKLVSVVYYLSPGDYHRYHSHDRVTVEKINHVPGELDVVMEKGIHEKTYTKNERIVVIGDSPLGKYYYGIVGATNVGSMSLTFDESVRSNILEHDNKVKKFLLFIRLKKI